MAVTSDDVLQINKDKDIIIQNDSSIQIFFNWTITGDASGGGIAFYFRADDTYRDLPKGHHLFLTHLSFITNDITSYPNNLSCQILYMRPKLQHEYQITLGYHNNQTELCTPIQDYTGNPIYCGLTRKQLAGLTPSRIQLSFSPNTNLKTYTIKMETICKK